LHQQLGVDRLPTDPLVKISAGLKKLGGLMIASAEQLASVPLRDVPIRLEPIYGDRLPSLEAFESGDGLVVQLEHSASKQRSAKLHSLTFEWPIDVRSLASFGKKIEMLRRISQNSIPVGISLPVYLSPPEDVSIAEYAWLNQLPIDFAILRTSMSCLTLHHPACQRFPCNPEMVAEKFRRLFDDGGNSPVSLAIDFPWSDGYQAVATIFAGADAVTLDRWFSDRAPRRHEASGKDNLLLAASTKNKVEFLMEQTAYQNRLRDDWDVIGWLREFTEQFRAGMDWVG
jgi:hypothetical protein